MNSYINIIQYKGIQGYLKELQETQKAVDELLQHIRLCQLNKRLKALIKGAKGAINRRLRGD